MQNNHLSNSIFATDGKAKYDAKVKELLSDKQILAWILRDTVNEFQGMSIEEIIPCIEEEPEIALVPVYPGITNAVIKGSQNENAVPNEGVVTYDIRFFAITPYGENIKILLNIEAQKKYNPGYDLVTRAIFYCARMLSAQLDTEFSSQNYDEVKKGILHMDMYGLAGLCTDTITRYSIEPKQLYGNFEGKARYDLLSAVMVCLAKEGKEKTGSKLHKMLGILLSDEISAEEKLSTLNKDYSMEISKKLETEVESMCNLSDLIEEKGIEKGIEQVAIKLIHSGDTNEKINLVTGLPLDRITELRAQETCTV